MHRSFFNPDESGQGLVEYALLLVLVAVVVIGILSALGPKISDIFNEVVASLEGGQPSYSAIVGPYCANRGHASGQQLSYPPGPGGADVVFYLQTDGWAYTRFENDTFFTSNAGDVVEIYGSVPSGATYSCP